MLEAFSCHRVFASSHPSTHSFLKSISSKLILKGEARLSLANQIFYLLHFSEKEKANIFFKSDKEIKKFSWQKTVNALSSHFLRKKLS
jgi:hypothetical protein